MQRRFEPRAAAQLALIVDLVGWDGANFFEGAAAPATTNTTAVFRAAKAAPTRTTTPPISRRRARPRNTASAVNLYSGPPPSTNPSGVGAANPASVPAGGWRC